MSFVSSFNISRIILKLDIPSQPRTQGESQQTSNVLANSFSRNLVHSALPADITVDIIQHFYNNDTHGSSLCSFVDTSQHQLQPSASVLYPPDPRARCGGVCLWQDQRPLRQRGLLERSRRNVRWEIWEVREQIQLKPLDLKRSNFRYGTCADGLMCSNCNRCQGCSFRTFICWDDRNCIWWQTELNNSHWSVLSLSIVFIYRNIF